MQIIRKNENTYATPRRKTLKMEVEFCLDMFPGAWHEPQDLMEWIASHSYVKQVTFDTDQLD